MLLVSNRDTVCPYQEIPERPPLVSFQLTSKLDLHCLQKIGAHFHEGLTPAGPDCWPQSLGCAFSDAVALLASSGCQSSPLTGVVRNPA